MDYETLKRNWDAYALSDPMHAILTWPSKAGNRWTPEEFFANGVSDWDKIKGIAQGRSLPLGDRVLDYGCGMGRMSQAMAQEGREVIGYDISGEMLDLARTHLPETLAGRVEYVSEVASGYSMVVSFLTLQHNPPAQQLEMLDQMCAALDNGGTLIFQLPDENLAERGQGFPTMDMYGQSRDVITKFLAERHVSVLWVEKNEPRNTHYFCVKYDAAPLKAHAQGDMGIYVRAGAYADFDRGIVSEVTTAYPVDFSKIETMVDVGAHIGSFTRYAMHRNPNIQAVCVEPDPDNALLCEINTASYRYDSNNPRVKVYRNACGYFPDSTVDLHLWRHNRNSGGNQLKPEGALPEPIEEWQDVGAVPLITLESIIKEQKLKKIDLLKIDCEGSEFDILSNAKESTLKKIGQIVGEFHGTEEDFQTYIGDRLGQWFKISLLKYSAQLGIFTAERL